MIKLLLIAVLVWVAYTQFKKTPMSFTNLGVGGICALVALFLILGLFGHVVFVFSVSLLFLLAVVVIFFLFTRTRSTSKT